jgi:hypothetical protein
MLMLERKRETWNKNERLGEKKVRVWRDGGKKMREGEGNI